MPVARVVTTMAMNALVKTMVMIAAMALWVSMYRRPVAMMHDQCGRYAAANTSKTGDLA